MILRVPTSRRACRARDKGVHKRAKMQSCLVINPTETHGRRERKIAILLYGVIGCNESSAQHDTVDQCECGGRNPEFHFPAHGLFHPNPRIGPVEEDVRKEVSHHQKRCREHDSRHHNVHIPLENRFQEQRTNARPAHNHFNQQGAAQECS